MEESERYLAWPSIALAEQNQILWLIYITTGRTVELLPRKVGRKKCRLFCSFRSLGLITAGAAKEKSLGARSARAALASFAKQSILFLPDLAALRTPLLRWVVVPQVQERWHQLNSVHNVCYSSPHRRSRQRRGGEGISSRKAAETGNRGPVIEAICFNKDMLLVVKQIQERREWPAPEPPLQKCNSFTI